MAKNGYAAASRAVHRTAADEEADRQQILDNMAKPALFDEWPNEIGFEGLQEERGPIEIPVIGTIPVWAAGSLYRTGPGQNTVEGTPKGTHQISHWFDGLAHTHRFEIVAPKRDGRPVRVFYSSRRQCEKLEATMRTKGTSDLYSFAQRNDPCIGILGKFMSTFRRAMLGPKATRPRLAHQENVNVNVTVFANLPPMPGRPAPPSTSSPPPPPATAGHRAETLDNIWTTTDGCMMCEVDPRTLEPIGLAVQDVLHPELRGQLSSSHAQRDPLTGDVYNFNLELGPAPTYRVFCWRMATGAVDILATIRCDSTTGVRPSYIHSFFLSAHHIVLCIPSTHIAYSGLKILWERSLLDGLEPFDPRKKMRWLVIDRAAATGGGGVVGTFESPAGFFFHAVNAYEETGTGSGGRTSLICDLVEYPTTDILHSFYYDVLLNRNGQGAAFYQDPARAASVIPSLARYRLTLPGEADEDEKDKEQEQKELSGTPGASPIEPATRLWSIPGPHAGELPIINPACATRRHRYVYGISNTGRGVVIADAICKTDTLTRAALRWLAPPGHIPGEAIFIARPARPGHHVRDEDDGVLLSVVLDTRAARSYLVCLDARTLTELGRAEVGFAVALGFHGLHTTRRP